MSQSQPQDYLSDNEEATLIEDSHLQPLTSQPPAFVSTVEITPMWSPSQSPFWDPIAYVSSSCYRSPSPDPRKVALLEKILEELDAEDAGEKAGSVTQQSDVVEAADETQTTEIIPTVKEVNTSDPIQERDEAVALAELMVEQRSWAVGEIVLLRNQIQGLEKEVWDLRFKMGYAAKLLNQCGTSLEARIDWMEFTAKYLYLSGPHPDACTASINYKKEE
ncbi:hypothetical protein CPB83DRAFT_900355 [Crepidotus variabilis]|uniref:Uncharacterized protein n=1 Tax=Crepidotus variabilis TaxID=179855 RepID=A0A9P6JHZ2_9AGAR|nr:hypothetical protein CPB83DRAFT_900355 [Crepidotus variabilis]